MPANPTDDTDRMKETHEMVKICFVRNPAQTHLHEHVIWLFHTHSYVIFIFFLSLCISISFVHTLAVNVTASELVHFFLFAHITCDDTTGVVDSIFFDIFTQYIENEGKQM